MSTPFYVSPEQVMKDRADYARKGISRGRSLVALECAAGVVIVADNPSRTLQKISEIYDRIAFAAVGLYSEYQLLRMAGVRHADLKGYSYSREDVSAQGARDRVLADAAPDLHARDEAVRGRAARRRGRPRRRRPRRDVPRDLRRRRHRRAATTPCSAARPKPITEALKDAVPAGTRARRRGPARREGARPDRRTARRGAARGRAARPDPAATRVPAHQERRARRHPRELT